MEIKFKKTDVVQIQPYLQGITFQLTGSAQYQVYIPIPSITMVIHELESHNLIIELNNGKNIIIEAGASDFYDPLLNILFKYNNDHVPRELVCNADKFRCNY